ncbi:hypothetical protein HanIR_Chr06g0263151 [Helianthus annuus]|nr:hypothetical protein HanIR_Chr06g0263151 [Helianthus annuus]
MEFDKKNGQCLVLAECDRERGKPGENSSPQNLTKKSSKSRGFKAEFLVHELGI